MEARGHRYPHSFYGKPFDFNCRWLVIEHKPGDVSGGMDHDAVCNASHSIQRCVEEVETKTTAGLATPITAAKPTYFDKYIS